MIAWDIKSDLGVTVVDPHGAQVEDILEHNIPKHRTKVGDGIGGFAGGARRRPPSFFG